MSEAKKISYEAARDELAEVVESLGYKTVRTFNDWKLIKIRCFTHNE